MLGRLHGRCGDRGCLSGRQTWSGLVLRPIVGAIIVAADVLPVEVTVTVAITSAGLGNAELASCGK